MDESDRKPSFNWLRAIKDFCLFTSLKVQEAGEFGAPGMLQSFGFLHFLEFLPFMMLTSFYLVVLSNSRFSIEGDNSKSNIFVFRLKAPAAALRFSSRSDAESH